MLSTRNAAVKLLRDIEMLESMVEDVPQAAKAACDLLPAMNIAEAYFVLIGARLQKRVADGRLRQKVVAGEGSIMDAIAVVAKDKPKSSRNRKRAERRR